MGFYDFVDCRNTWKFQYFGLAKAAFYSGTTQTSIYSPAFPGSFGISFSTSSGFDLRFELLGEV